MTDGRPPGHLRPARAESVAGSSGTGRDTTGGTPAGAPAGASTGSPTGAPARAPTGGPARALAGGGRAPGVGTAGTRPTGTHARLNPAAELGFSGDPGQHGDPDDGMLHAQRVWDGTLATNRLDEQGVNAERLRVETKGVTVGVGLLVDGWPQDVRACLQSVVEHTGARVLALDLGNVDGAGDVLTELAERHPERIAVWHVAERPHWQGGAATWGECRAKLLRLDEAEVHVLMDTDVVLCGDAITPLVAAVTEGAVAAAWKGLDLIDERWCEAEPGRVRALTGGLIAVRRAQAIGALPADASCGAYADLEFSLGLPGDLVVPNEAAPVLPLGRHDLPPGYLARESRRTYDRVLRMLRAS
ncbi:hypothetical protein FAF44_18835 [Nonomuraea sp. MG754425]|uniref:glycosyltransferase family 2 protein n=1 Tax=Nonomuraea sp. MG754425 TaxID=2570319 RepID=UPI001F36C43F|nr:hypothetical protein [Nonomuraea sp. MG754425]MCF6470436.1 hypothetical protein [Nonomuraea sp. MG754425]